MNRAEREAVATTVAWRDMRSFFTAGVVVRYDDGSSEDLGWLDPGNAPDDLKSGERVLAGRKPEGEPYVLLPELPGGVVTRVERYDWSDAPYIRDFTRMRLAVQFDDGAQEAFDALWATDVNDFKGLREGSTVSVSRLDGGGVYIRSADSRRVSL
jgi:hypothetical protein